MPTTLTDQNISDTYLGILHSSGQELPSSGQALIYDGDGNGSSISLGKVGEGLTVTGTISSTGNASFANTVVTALTASTLKYPTADGGAGAFLRTSGTKQLYFSTTIPSSAIEALSPSPAGTYTNPSSITVNNKGQVTSATSGTVSTTSTIWRYVTPILIYNHSVTGVNDLTVGPITIDLTNQPNRPSSANYAIILIEGQYRCDTDGTQDVFTKVSINGFNALTAGVVHALSDSFNGQRNTLEYSALLTSSQFTVTTQYHLNDNAKMGAVNIWLVGFAAYNTLSNS